MFQSYVSIIYGLEPGPLNFEHTYLDRLMNKRGIENGY